MRPARLVGSSAASVSRGHVHQSQFCTGASYSVSRSKVMELLGPDSLEEIQQIDELLRRRSCCAHKVGSIGPSSTSMASIQSLTTTSAPTPAEVSDKAILSSVIPCQDLIMHHVKTRASAPTRNFANAQSMSNWPSGLHDGSVESFPWPHRASTKRRISESRDDAGAPYPEKHSLPLPPQTCLQKKAHPLPQPNLMCSSTLWPWNTQKR